VVVAFSVIVQGLTVKPLLVRASKEEEAAAN
jgi:NhaP-type Na+/H+ or K+/H+ antiporter